MKTQTTVFALGLVVLHVFLAAAAPAAAVEASDVQWQLQSETQDPYDESVLEDVPSTAAESVISEAQQTGTAGLCRAAAGYSPAGKLCGEK
jgi:hypothetical protein